MTELIHAYRNNYDESNTCSYLHSNFLAPLTHIGGLDGIGVITLLEFYAEIRKNLIFVYETDCLKHALI